MPTKVKPKQRSQSSGTFSIEPLSDSDFIKIAKTLKMEDLTDSVRKELSDIAHEYGMGVELAKSQQTSPELRCTLGTVRKSATDLSQSLKTLDAASREKIELRLSGAFVPQMKSFVCPFCEREFADEVSHRNHLSDHETFSARRTVIHADILERCQADAERIALAAHDALKSISSKPGPKHPRAPLWRTVNRLGAIYQDLMGRPARVTFSEYTGNYSGRFLDFVVCFMRLVDPQGDNPSPNALGDYIKKNPPNKNKHVN